MAETMALCVGCKACKRECPTGVDMARMKIEVAHWRAKTRGLSLRDRLVAWLPRYAPTVSKLAPLANLRNRSSVLRWLGERAVGLAAVRDLPHWSRAPFTEAPPAVGEGPEVALFADTFNTWFEPDNARAAHAVLTRAGYRVHVARAPDGGRPLCCGRTFLSVGLVDEARAEATRTLAALTPLIERGMPVVGLEPSCLLTFRDEFKALLPGRETDRLAAAALLFEEFVVAERTAGRFELPFRALDASSALVHGHCHQKAFGVAGAVAEVLRLVPGLDVETIEASCCGMAGAFGHEAEHYDTSMAIGELDLLPAVRAAGDDVLLVADGISCRQQIAHGAGRKAVHAAQVLARACAAP
jgi:Fe-S oxidoreductase